MNNSKIKIFLIISIVASQSITFAGGSSFSRYGFGDILRNGDSRTYAMSGTGIALLDDGFINGLNPAGLARISYTRFSAGFEYNNFLSKDETGSSFYSTGGFQGLAFAFPISRENGIVMSAEFAPFSTVSYGITSSLFDSLTQSQQDKTFYGSGGLSSIGLGLSASPLSTLHIGARFDYMYGRTHQYQTTSFNSTYLTSLTFDRATYYSGFTFTLGAIYEGVDQLLNLPSLHNLSLGFTLRAASSLDANIKRIYSEGDTTNQNGTADIPLSTGFGLSYLLQNRYRFLGDIVTENWGSVQNFGIHPTELRNSLRASFGFETLPAKEADTFWKRIVYRAGLAYNSTYYQINGIGINEFLVSGGLGFPMGPESQLNIGLQIGVRGSTDNYLQKDTFVRLSVAVSANEIWFLRFDEE
ncbi:MAG: hypothetical protein NTX44_06845 [Ignavibacteriales bacterium]|nr:hypothetical protein [Ignavibacteriales bacterium]